MARPPKFGDDEILDRAMTILWERGWTQTSIRDLEQALEIKAPSIYRRFGSKEGLGTAVIDHYVEHVVQGRVDRYLSGEGDPIDNLTRFLDSSVRSSGDNGRLWGCLLTTTAVDLGGEDSALFEARQRGYAVIEEGLRGEVWRAAELGQIAPGVMPGDATATLALAMQGLMALARGGAPSTELRRRARAAVSTIASPTEA
ncbi:MAG: TetR/AcrR family transcriptional regulator [Actinomycetota bacterium]